MSHDYSTHDWSLLTVPELRSELELHGVTVSSRAPKAQLIRHLIATLDQRQPHQHTSRVQTLLRGRAPSSQVARPLPIAEGGWRPQVTPMGAIIAQRRREGKEVPDYMIQGDLKQRGYWRIPLPPSEKG